MEGLGLYLLHNVAVGLKIAHLRYDEFDRAQNLEVKHSTALCELLVLAVSKTRYTAKYTHDTAADE